MPRGRDLDRYFFDDIDDYTRGRIPNRMPDHFISAEECEYRLMQHAREWAANMPVAIVEHYDVRVDLTYIRGRLFDFQAQREINREYSERHTSRSAHIAYKDYLKRHISEELKHHVAGVFEEQARRDMRGLLGGILGTTQNMTITSNNTSQLGNVTNQSATEAQARQAISAREMMNYLQQIDQQRQHQQRMAQELAEQYQRAGRGNGGLGNMFGGIGNVFVDRARDFVDRFDGEKAKPDDATLIAWMEKLPAVIEWQGIKAELLNSPNRIYEEAQTLGHCLWRSYSDRIISARYVAYHIIGDRARFGTRTGFTLGFKRDENPMAGQLIEKTTVTKDISFSQVTDRTRIPLWKYEQCKGKSNDTRNVNDEVKKFCEYVSLVLNEIELPALPQTEKQKYSDYLRQQPYDVAHEQQRRAQQARVEAEYNYRVQFEQSRLRTDPMNYARMWLGE